MASYNETANLISELRSRYPYSMEMEEDSVVSGDYYISLIADFGSEQEISPLPTGWSFSGWENRDQRALLATIMKIS